MIVFIFAIALLEGQSIIRDKNRKEMLVVAILVLLALIYGLDYTFQLHYLPDPKDLIYQFYPFARQYENFFNMQY